MGGGEGKREGGGNAGWQYTVTGYVHRGPLLKAQRRRSEGRGMRHSSGPATPSVQRRLVRQVQLASFGGLQRLQVARDPGHTPRQEQHPTWQQLATLTCSHTSTTPQTTAWDAAAGGSGGRSGHTTRPSGSFLCLWRLDGSGDCKGNSRGTEQQHQPIVHPGKPMNAAVRQQKKRRVWRMTGQGKGAVGVPLTEPSVRVRTKRRTDSGSSISCIQTTTTTTRKHYN